MEIRFTEIAQAELDEAVEYYNYEIPDLGDKFLIEVLRSIDIIEKFPDAWSQCSKRTRRFLLRRFPYGIIYQIRKTEILIIAVANLHRNPNYWKDRV